MSFIQSDNTSRVFNAGYFLADTGNCTRKTYTAKQNDSHVITMSDGTKILPGGSVYSIVEEGEMGDVTVYIGIVYEDVDVTSGDMPCSVVTAGTVYTERVPEASDAEVKSALEYIGIKFMNEPTVTRTSTEETESDIRPGDMDGE